VLKKNIWANFQRIIELFTQKIVTKLSYRWVWDPGSEIRDSGSGKNLFRILDPGVKKAPDPGSGSATLLLAAGSGELGGREAGDAAGCAGHLRQLSAGQGGRRGRGHHPCPHRQEPGRGEAAAGLLKTSLQLFMRFLN
jgi:hypothetical protein